MTAKGPTVQKLALAAKRTFNDDSARDVNLIASEQFQKEFADLNRIRPNDAAQPPQTGGVQSEQSPEGAQSKEQQAQNVIEELVKELSSLEDQCERRKGLEDRSRNIYGQRLLGYTMA